LPWYNCDNDDYYNDDDDDDMIRLLIILYNDFGMRWNKNSSCRSCHSVECEYSFIQFERLSL